LLYVVTLGCTYAIIDYFTKPFLEPFYYILLFLKLNLKLILGILGIVLKDRGTLQWLGILKLDE